MGFKGNTKHWHRHVVKIQIKSIDTCLLCTYNIKRENLFHENENEIPSLLTF
jgi:hypothetical protein